MLGPLLFLLYTNDLDDTVGSNILKLADDTKIFRKVRSGQDSQVLQEDLDSLVRWSEKWQMLFNQYKCKCIHIGRSNGKSDYTIQNAVLNTTATEKDIDVVIQADLKVSEQCGIAARKGNQLLGMMSSSDNYRAITLGSTICKLFEYVILNKEGSKLGSNDLQFGFKQNVSTTQCAFALSEVISYYNFNRSNVYTVFLDATKAFDIGKLFRILIDKNMYMIVLRLLLNMYEKQKLQVKWGNHKSGMFDVNNGVKQGGVLSPVLFAVYIDELFDRLANCGHGCHLGNYFVGCFAYADDIAIIAPSKKGIDVMIKVCEEFAVDRDMNFNGKKSTFTIFKGRHCVKARDNITIGGVNLQDVDETVYLGFKLHAGDSYNIILPDIAQFWRSVNIFFADF